MWPWDTHVQLGPPCAIGTPTCHLDTPVPSYFNGTLTRHRDPHVPPGHPRALGPHVPLGWTPMCHRNPHVPLGHQHDIGMDPHMSLGHPHTIIFHWDPHVPPEPPCATGTPT